MGLKDFFLEVKDECSTVLRSEFDVEIIETDFVPNFDDSQITYDNLDTQKKSVNALNHVFCLLI